MVPACPDAFRANVAKAVGSRLLVAGRAAARALQYAPEVMRLLGKMVAGLWLSLPLLGACQKTEPEPVMRPASSTVVANDRAVEKLATTNCDRERACDNIGGGRRYESRELCLGTFEREKYEELGLSKCLLGVDYVQLDLCNREVATEGCSSPLYTLDTLSACRSDKLCRD